MPGAGENHGVDVHGIKVKVTATGKVQRQSYSEGYLETAFTVGAGGYLGQETRWGLTLGWA